jgi:nitroreductase
VASSTRRARLADEIGAAYRRIARGVGNPLVRVAMTLWIGPSRVQELRASVSGLQWAEEQIEQGKDPLFHHAPVVLLLHAPPAETAEADCALAAGQMSLLAPSLGLGTCHIGYASALLKRLPRIARGCGVPRGRRVFSVLTLGYPAVLWCGIPTRPEVPVVWR